ncbi:hypothetical protein ETU09_05945 [Apibacter muscae]|uniref:Uncharacterized protein n=1 Tax=Apibacter muscae TaxID=2509004 RepID=A0A563DE18_9FLAO|nr:hypothetical protein [Apibacter muscae]TWP28465.1 hypothetical protein ETU09_05945 [Apibacter muscae]
MKKILFLFGLLIINSCSSDDNYDDCKQTWNVTRYYEYPPECENKGEYPSTYDKEFSCNEVKNINEGDRILDSKLASCGGVYIRFNYRVK